jgi:osmoprotectant transport system ATP-binding protein
VERRAAEIVFDGVTKRYPGRAEPALSGLTLTVAAGELLVLAGPSGGGKTTALKLVNGLVPIDGGDIRIDGRSVRTLPATELRRGIGYVIQQVGLFPHMTVAANVATVPRLLGWPKARIRGRVSELLELVGLEQADGARYPASLSGGQRQRVGLARALAGDPPILLMDEPFAAVDPIVRAHLQAELRRLHREVGKTILFVTHDLDEALGLGDRIAIFGLGGVLAQVDTPDAVLAAPAGDFVRRFVGEDRALRRLALRRLGELPLEDGAAPNAPVASASATARNAVSLMLEAGARELRVVGDDGADRGVLRLEQVRELLG